MFANHAELADALAGYRRRHRQLLLRLGGLAIAFAVGFPLLLTRISPKRGGVILWLAVMSVFFTLAYIHGRRVEGRLASTRVRCPACTAELSGTWADLTLEQDRCPHCQAALVAPEPSP